MGDSTLTYDVTYGDNYTITNTKPQDYSDVTINKVWKDGSNAAGTRPATVSLTLVMAVMYQHFEDQVAASMRP